MADIDNNSQISVVPNLTEASASEVHKQFWRTEAERVRLAAAAQEAIPRGMVGDEAVKANKKKGKGKGKVKGNVADTNVAATYVAATPRPSSKQCKFCNMAGHVESECYTKQNLEKFKHKMVSEVTPKKEPTVSGNGYG
jgi:hypothetical protein